MYQYVIYTHAAFCYRRNKMSREVDVRDYSRDRATPQRAQLLQAKATQVTGRLEGAAALQLGRMNPHTGNPASISVVSSGTAPAAAASKYIQRALEYAQTISPALGLTEGQTPEFVADPNPAETSSGARAVNLQ